MIYIIADLCRVLSCFYLNAVALNKLDLMFLSKDIYYISEVPSKLLYSDVSAIAFISILLSIVATIYPSIKASNTSPAEALKHD